MSASMTAGLQGNGANRVNWQERLNDYCRRVKLQPPVFNIVSDRRGGRTAWSSHVTVGARTFSARYWYDGQYIDNAKEDAAEVALSQLNAQVQSPTTYQGQLYAQNTGAGTGY